LDTEASGVAVSKIAKKLNMDLMEAAKGIIDIANEKIFGALRLVSVEQGTWLTISYPRYEQWRLD